METFLPEELNYLNLPFFPSKLFHSNKIHVIIVRENGISLSAYTHYLPNAVHSLVTSFPFLFRWPVVTYNIYILK